MSLLFEEVCQVFEALALQSHSFLLLVVIAFRNETVSEFDSNSIDLRSDDLVLCLDSFLALNDGLISLRPVFVNFDKGLAVEKQ